MRLLYLCSDFGIPPDGTKGASIHLRAITAALAKAGHDVLLLSPKEGPDAPHPARRLLPAGCPAAEEPSKLLKQWMESRELDETLARELRPLLYNAWAGPRATEALSTGEPIDAIVERLSLMGHVGLDLADVLHVPLVVEVNALLTEEFRQFRSLALSEIAHSIEQRVLERADALMPVSDELAARIVSRGVDERKIRVVPNGADLERFAAAPSRTQCRTAMGLRDEFVVGFVGSLKPWHGVDVLIDAFAAFVDRCGGDQPPHARLLIVGTGPEEESLRRQTQQRGLESLVVFTGSVPHEAVPAIVRAMDVAAAPYRPLEGFYFSPIKLFEYVAGGACVVASRIGQIERIMVDGIHGLLCAPGDAGALAGALLRLHQQPGLRDALSSAGARDVASKFTWDRSAERVSDVVRGAIADRCAAPEELEPSAMNLSGIFNEVSVP